MTVTPPRMRDLVLDRDNHLCVLALAGCLGMASVADHRANRGSGGSSVLNDPRNLVAACTLCNGAKEDSTGHVREGLLVRGVRVLSAGTNAKTLARAGQTPVRYPDGRLFFLLPDGGREECGDPEF